MPTEPSSRRARLRAEALAEIRAHASAQLREGGPTAVSLNAIAKQMGMSGPALYRYYASRGALLSELVAEAWDELADALETAYAASSRRSAVNRLRAVADAYRAHALADPRRYRLMFDPDVEQGGIVGERAGRAMTTLLAALSAVAEGEEPKLVDMTLARELKAWGGGDAPPWLLRLGIASWQRFHGHLGLELEGIHAAMGVDPERLYAAELDDLVTLLR